MNKIMTFLKATFKSMLKFYAVFWGINAFIGYGLAFLWRYGALGETCRYYGSVVERCTLLGSNIDKFTELYLTIWVLPLVGPIGGVLLPFIAAFMLTLYVWPIYYVLKLVICKICSKGESKNDPSH